MTINTDKIIGLNTGFSTPSECCKLPAWLKKLIKNVMRLFERFTQKEIPFYKEPSLTPILFEMISNTEAKLNGIAIPSGDHSFQSCDPEKVKRTLAACKRDRALIYDMYRLSDSTFSPNEFHSFNRRLSKIDQVIDRKIKKLEQCEQKFKKYVQRAQQKRERLSTVCVHGRFSRAL